MRDLILNNLWLKLLSLCLAVVIVAAIRRDEIGSIRTPALNPTPETATIPVFVLTHPADARIFQVTPDRVAITLVGEPAILQKYTRKDYRAYVDLSEIERRGDGTNNQKEVRVHLPHQQILLMKTVPPAVTVEQVSP